MTSCTVLILTYKGKHHLEQLLPTVRESIDNSPNYLIDVLIVDNGQDELTKDFVNQNYPEYSFNYSPSNDYLFSLNIFVKSLTKDIVLILNDDMKVDKEIFNHTLDFFKHDPTLYSVNCRLLNWDGNGYQNSVRLMHYSKGWVTTFWRDEQPKAPEYTLYGGGGSAFFRVNMYNQLGGFDDYFRPAYCEDLDLSHRAWKKGWPSIIQPLAIIFHRDGATIKEQYKNQSDTLTQRIYTNQVKWMLRNCDLPGFKLWFSILLVKRLIFGWITDQNSWVALQRGLRSYLQLKRKIDKQVVYSDKTICEKFLNRLYITK